MLYEYIYVYIHIYMIYRSISRRRRRSVRSGRCPRLGRSGPMVVWGGGGGVNLWLYPWSRSTSTRGPPRGGLSQPLSHQQGARYINICVYIYNLCIIFMGPLPLYLFLFVFIYTSAVPALLRRFSRSKWQFHQILAPKMMDSLLFTLQMNILTVFGSFFHFLDTRNDGFATI